jgi:type II secretory pathway pseudopilin PulG
MKRAQEMSRYDSRKMHRLCARRKTSNPLRAMTLLEVMFAATLSVIITGAVVGFLLYMTKLNKSTFSQLKFGHFSKQTIERMAGVIRYAKRIEVTSDGTRLDCWDENDRNHTIYFSDGDNDPWTLANNCLYYNSPNLSTPDSICHYVSPIPGRPIFAYRDRTTPVEINFRIGDPLRAPAAKFHRETGPGPQGVTISTACGPRNSYLDLN